jgi:diketogulonate reductase-like aldo/keto reductase
MHRNLCRPRRSKRHLTILAVTLVVCRSPPEHRVQENAAATRVALSADDLADLHSLTDASASTAIATTPPHMAYVNR